MKKSTNFGTAIACIAMVVTFFAFPFISYSSPWGDAGSYSMWGILTSSGGEGKFWLFMLLLVPIYLLLDVYRDKLPIPQVAFPLSSGVSTLLPLILIVFMGGFLGGGSIHSTMEDGSKFINFGALFDNTGWGYYVYLATAIICTQTGCADGRWGLNAADLRGAALALSAMLAMVVTSNQIALYSMDRHTIFDFDMNGHLTISGMLMGYGWILTIFLIYLAVSAFRHKEIFANFRKLLLSPRILTIVVAVVAILLLILSIGFKIADEGDFGSAPISFLFLSIGMVVMAYRNVEEH